MLNLCVSAIASNQGKTILTVALLYHFRKSVRPFKIGPDFIDPQFHKKVCGTNSVSLDSFMMSSEQVRWMFENYSDKDVSIIEGVMGFYDGDNKGCSAYSVSKLLNVPTVLVLDGSGSYITVSAVLKGLLKYKKDNTIQAVVLNKLSSTMHYQLIREQIEHDHKDIKVLGWIEKNLSSLQDTHLGLDLNDLDKIEQISKDVLKHIDINIIETMRQNRAKAVVTYPFLKIDKIDAKVAIVYDENFSFLYYDNLIFLKEIFAEVIIVKSTANEPIPKDCDSVYICGGYVESDKAYSRIKNSDIFRESLKLHAKSKKIYAECAGLLYLAKRVDDKEMSGILDISFTMQKRFARLGYYYNQLGIKGHAFHYSSPTEQSLKSAFDILSKTSNGKGEMGSWSEGMVFGTYLHTMFRNNVNLIQKYL